MTRHHPDCDVLNATRDRETQDTFGIHSDDETLIEPSDYACLSECQPEIAYVTGTITFDNGETVEFELQPGYDSRWGNVREMLGHAVDPCEAMWNALALGDFPYFAKEDQT